MQRDLQGWVNLNTLLKGVLQNHNINGLSFWSWGSDLWDPCHQHNEGAVWSAMPRTAACPTQVNGTSCSTRHSHSYNCAAVPPTYWTAINQKWIGHQCSGELLETMSHSQRTGNQPHKESTFCRSTFQSRPKERRRNSWIPPHLYIVLFFLQSWKMDKTVLIEAHSS